MNGIIFSGPSLSRGAVEAAGFEWRPPVRQGDVTAALRARPSAIGIVDGVFESVPTVWHKEILRAMDEGVSVYGASSIGALRAAELDAFGMIGVGEIYAAYRDGTLEDDDEVAVLHAPAELGFFPLTEAMVNLRATISAAEVSGRLDRETAKSFLTACKVVFYKDRSPERLAALGEKLLGETFSLGPRIDRKRMDAEALLERLQDRPNFNAPPDG